MDPTAPQARVLDRSRSWRQWLLVLLLAATSAKADSADAHLLAGVDHFRDEHFELALVELKVARQLGARGEVDWYVAATLTKLHRVDEALETFAQARAEAPDAGDPLLDYSQAMACYEARLLVCADALLARVEAAAGPRVAGQARKVRADIATVLAVEPPPGAVDTCVARGREALTGGRVALAAIYFEEGLALAKHRADGHGQGVAAEGLAAARRATARSSRP